MGIAVSWLAFAAPPPRITGSAGGGHGRAEADLASSIRGLCLTGSVSPEAGVRVLTLEYAEDCGVSDFTLEYTEDYGVSNFTLEYTEEGEENDPMCEQWEGCAVRVRTLEYTVSRGRER